ncbi:MAG TPA: BREX system Lon protease-like protein BrxL [Candidatus Methanoculleus thermohydrogenotrophicum]|nr:BREX system Lon protease-like protein BrxL [Candidatus Methanoculleus thermohydrogenotrophicum]NLM81160.1 BREX system Lon protease-like protein BrxL [Candidatus Methanoculleus thermohydrogenotrophicum]HOB18801.1 BREX system Lon protease-like protein BrxL [Candidatus Methanoculleus thermohydrogenotrophicum]HPZ38909.1 BREX system Lon protease-like protein BrxL [Candidatus Methanoculleus thermohydrogenotrophicum]HQC91984.1 BREX system Lon protease-like protein BrxL [Candidatus Methanoculleus th
MAAELDALDQLVADVFDGYVVRKDLAQKFKGNYPVPTYVAEFLIGKYCATTDEDEIKEGLEIVQRQLGERIVRAGEQELYKAQAKIHGSVKVIDLITARLDARSDSFIATVPSLLLNDVHISSDLIYEHERMLTGGFYAEIDLAYGDPESNRPFSITRLRPIQLSKRNVLDDVTRGRASMADQEWKEFLIRSIGLEPSSLSPRAQDVLFLRMVPFVEKGYNMIELGPRGTGKSHLYQQVSPYSHLVSGGKATVAKMFVNNATGQRGLVCQYDIVCFDEVSGINFDQKDGVNIMKGYMESGEFSRGRESIRAEGGIVMLGNFDVDVDHQQRVGHLFGPLPKEIRDDTAFMDRIHSYVPGWDFPKIHPDMMTEHFGLVSDFLSECWRQLRSENRLHLINDRVFFGDALSGRDRRAVNKTINGLLKLVYPSPDMEIADEILEWAVRLALECRRRVKEQQKRIGSAEFRNTMFSYRLGLDGIEQYVSTPELHSENEIGQDPLPPGQAWAVGPGDENEGSGLYKIEVTVTPGSSIRLINVRAPPGLREGLRAAEQVLYTQAKSLIGDRDPLGSEFSVQVRALTAVKGASSLGMPLLLALCSAALGRSLKGGVVIAGGMSVGGTVEPVYNALDMAELAAENGATAILLPVSSRRQLNEMSDDLASRLMVIYYKDPRDALFKVIGE